jgi:signal peptidase II
MRRKKNHLVFWLVSLAGFLFDQITKILVFKRLYPGEVREVLPGVFRLRPWMQTGMAWGLFGGHNLVLTIVSTLAIITVITIFLFLASRLDGQTTFALALIIGGAAGNLCDRIAVGQVRDFLDFYLIGWPIFNIADVLICIGAGVMILKMLRETKAAQQ